MVSAFIEEAIATLLSECDPRSWMSIATSNLSLVFGEMVQVAEYSLATWETEALVRQQSLLPRLWDKPARLLGHLLATTGHHKRNTI